MSGRAARIAVGLVLSAIVLGVFAVFYSSPAAARLEYSLLDFWFHMRGPIADRGDVIKVTMDEASYQNLGVPLDRAWPRALHVKLLKKFREAGVKRVVFDVLFLEAGADTEVDAAFVEQMDQIPTVLASDQGVRLTAHGEVVELLLPYAPFASVATPALAGLPEESGYIRGFRHPEGDAELLPLSFAAADLGPSTPRPSQHDLINFYGPAGFIPSYSVYQVLEEAVPFPPEKLRGKTIFVGLELRSGLGPEQKDSFLTSFDELGRHFGVEIHATAAANLLAQDWIRRASPANERLFLLALLSVVCGSCLFLKPFRSAMVVGLSLLVWIGASFVLFRLQFFLPGLTVAAIFAPGVYVGSTLMYYVITRQRQRQLRLAFELYVSPHTAAQVTRDPSALGLGGKQVYATAIFTDIADFTKICESMSPHEVAGMLNDYFSEIVDFIFASQGTLIKFIGDAVFALWGAPVEHERHADAALRAGIEIQRKLRNSDVLKRYPPLITRIGINTGLMVVGNLGSRKRFDFTAIGDPVNLASRVESLNKYLGTSLLITEFTRSELKDEYPILPMGKVRVVGKEDSVMMYAVLEELSNEDRAQWTHTIGLFAERKWDEAAKGFDEIAARVAPLRKAATFYVDQLEHHRVIPPALTWAGELILESK
jgi:adenylate cyclase